ncbi:MAG TPA: hypothetical protein VET51_02240 [Burkholderiales bacterium]|nr:hypothetical protein [Burkholderiales bacterium]
MRLLCCVQERATHRLREIYLNKSIRRVQVILTAFVYDSDVTVFGGIFIR